MAEQNRILDISWGTIFKVAVAATIAYILYLIRDVLIWFIFAVILSILFNPAIDFLQKRKIPRAIGATLVYLGVFAVFSLLTYFIAAIFFNELQQFSQFFPQYFETASPFLKEIGLKAFENIESFTAAMSGILGQITSNLANVLFVVFGGLFSTIFVISMAFFLSLEQKPIESALGVFFPRDREGYVLQLWERCRKRVSGWFLTRILACIFVGVFSYIAFLIFGTKYPFTLAMMAGVLNFIPVLGPIATGALIFIIAALDSFLMATFVLTAFLLIQQVENNIVTPILSKKFIGLSPVLVLIALVIGGKLWGFIGAILSIPLFGIFYEFLKDFLKEKKEKGW